jgi:hypothetical protein
VPVIELRRGKYEHRNREYGEIRIPVFKIVDRMPVDELPSLEGVGIADQITDDREE